MESNNLNELTPEAVENESAINKEGYWSGDKVEYIAKSEMKQLNDPKCKHVWKLDPSDQSEHFFAIKCENCIVGKLIKRNGDNHLLFSWICTVS